MNKKSNEVSAVICTYNSQDTIELVIQSLVNNEVSEIIIVDANSTDRTIEIAKKYNVICLHDHREGLAKARNIGIAQVKNKYILNIGSDNIMPLKSVEKMLNYMIENNFSGVSAVTFLREYKKNYVSYAMNIYKKLRFFPGQRNVIGTPTLFATKLLQEHPYDNMMTHSDDGDLCTRLSLLGHKFAIADVIVEEAGFETFSAIVERWQRYGKSDWETYRKYAPKWTIKRKIQSLFYPFKNELILPLVYAKFLEKIIILPFLLTITFLRYFFWINYSLKSKKN